MTYMGAFLEDGFSPYLFQSPDTAAEYLQRNAALLQALSSANPVDPPQIAKNIQLWEPVESTARTIFMYETLQLTQHVPGFVHLFGLRFGPDMVRAVNLLKMMGQEVPVFGWDTFTGHAGTSEKDGDDRLVQPGEFTVPAGYQEWLTRLVGVHGGEAFMIAGDVRESFPTYLDEHPEALVRYALLDLDLYEPTAVVLRSLRERMVPGGVIVFDEVNNPRFPGETIAMREVMPGLELRTTAAGREADMVYAVWR